MYPQKEGFLIYYVLIKPSGTVGVQVVHECYVRMEALNDGFFKVQQFRVRGSFIEEYLAAEYKRTFG